jgi:ABC-type transporter Mla subunit MlaD
LFPPSFFDQLEDRLNLAVYDTNQDYRMDIPGVLSTSIGHTKRFLHLADRTVEVPLTATADEIRAALQDTTTMSITGAANLAGTIKDRINAAKAKVAQVSANTDSALAKLNDAADTGDKIAKQIEAEAEDLLAQIGQFSNGGPE